MKHDPPFTASFVTITDAPVYGKYELVDPIIENNFDKIKSMVENGFDVNPGGGYPVLLASRIKMFKILRYLIESGANYRNIDWASDFGVECPNSVEEAIEYIKIIEVNEK